MDGNIRTVILSSSVPGWVINRYGPSGPLPSIASDFKLNRHWDYRFGSMTLEQMWALTRTTTEYAVDSTGTWTQFGSGVFARTDLGLNGWEARTNSITFSDVPTVANSWNNENNTVTLQSGVGPGPGLDAYLYDNGTTAAVQHRLISPTNVSITSGDTWTQSSIVKYVNAQFVQLTMPTATFGATVFANFDILNGTIGTVGASASATITNYPNGWRLISITATATASVASQSVVSQVVLASNSIRSPAYTGANAQFLVWNQSWEKGASVTPPIRTTNAAVTRNADVITMRVPPVFGSGFGFYTQTGALGGVNTHQFVAQSGTNRFLYNGSGAATVGTFNGTNILSSTPGSGSVLTGVRSASGFDGSGRSIVSNGGTVATDSNVNAAPTIINLGSDGAASFQNGPTLEFAAFTAGRPPDAQLKELSTP